MTTPIPSTDAAAPTGATIVHAPAPIPDSPNRPRVFLAGSIEMGRAVDWQSEVVAALSPLDCVILNPRRPDWDASWVQEAMNPQFNQQVTWELAAQEAADVILFYFAPGTQSPITLLELGLFGAHDTSIVCCPQGFWRKGNVDIVCERYEIPTADSLDQLISMAAFVITNLPVMAKALAASQDVEEGDQ